MRWSCCGFFLWEEHVENWAMELLEGLNFVLRNNEKWQKEIWLIIKTSLEVQLRSIISDARRNWSHFQYIHTGLNLKISVSEVYLQNVQLVTIVAQILSIKGILLKTDWYRIFFLQVDGLALFVADPYWFNSTIRPNTLNKAIAITFNQWCN